MVRAIAEKRFDDFSNAVPSTVEKCYRTGIPLVVVNRLTPVAPQIEFELIQTLAMLNLDERLTIKAAQLPMIANGIVEDWPVLSVEDICLCLKRGARGHFGRIFRMDAAIINEWLSAYCEERVTLQEQGVREDKREYDQIDYEAFKKRLEEERRKENARAEAKRNSRIIELAAKGESAKYQTTPEEAVLKELHWEWTRANFDPITGKPLDTWVSEEEWMKTQKI